jgi:UDP-N-acetylmuramate dehydrogenase
MIDNTSSVFEKLEDINDLICDFDVSLKNYSTWKIGGHCPLIVKPKSIQQIIDIIKIFKKSDFKNYMVIGSGSNLLFSDDGYDGIIIHISEHLNEIECINKTTVRCDAGVWVPYLAYKSYQLGLTGLEHICGIPGTLGGLIYMNGGSNRQAISDSLIDIFTIDDKGILKKYVVSELQFQYRKSPFQTRNEIIVSATLKLEIGNKEYIRKKILGIFKSRRDKFPRKLPNCGSVFASDPKMYTEIGAPGFAIQSAGLKGKIIGGAQISTLHANFITNINNAKATDVLELIQLARNTVYDKTGFLMDCEVRYVDRNGNIKPADDVKVF